MCDMQERGPIGERIILVTSSDVRFGYMRPEYQDLRFHTYEGDGPCDGSSTDMTEVENRQIAFYSKCLQENPVDQKFNRSTCVGAMAAALIADGTLKPLSDETQATSKGRRRDGRPNIRPGQSSGLHKNHSADEYRRQAVANSVNGCGPRVRRARDAWIKKIEEETGRRLTKEERGRAINNFNALKPFQGGR